MIEVDKNYIKFFIKDLQKKGYLNYHANCDWLDAHYHFDFMFESMINENKNHIYFSPLSFNNFSKTTVLYHGGLFNLKTKKIDSRVAYFSIEEGLNKNFETVKKEFEFIEKRWFKADIIILGFFSKKDLNYYNKIYKSTFLKNSNFTFIFSNISSMYGDYLFLSDSNENFKEFYIDWNKNFKKNYKDIQFAIETDFENICIDKNSKKNSLKLNLDSLTFSKIKTN